MARTPPATVELDLAGTWVNVTSKVRHEAGITITRGRADEASGTEPSSCHLTLDNRAGDFSPRNPMGAYFGVIGRNTPMRVSVNRGATRLFTGLSTSNYISAPDTAGLSITGDVDIRIDARFQSWRVLNSGLINKGAAVGARSYAISMGADGKPILYWSADGTTWLTLTSTLPVPRTTGRQAIRATLDVDNGAGGRTAVFYTAPTITGTWTQLGDPVTAAGVTSIFNSTAALIVGIGGPEGYHYASEVREGIAGTIRANPDFTIHADGATSFVDSAGNTWTRQGAAAITNKRQRFIGEVSNWPTRWGVDERNIYAPVEAAGILRRLGQGDAPLRSAYYRAVTGVATGLTGYWPMEDPAGSTQFATVTAKTPRATVMYINPGTSELASNTAFIASEALPTVGTGVFTGHIGSPFSDVNQAWEVRALVAVSAAGATNLAPLFRVFLSNGFFADLVYGTGGTLGFNVYTNTGTLVTSQVQQTYGQSLDGDLRLVSLESNASSTGIATLRPGTDTGYAQGTGTGYGLGRVTAVMVNPFGTLGAVGIGHVYVQRHLVNASIFELKFALDAYAGDTAGARFARLCTEQGVPATIIGDTAGSETMGPQLPRTFTELLGECAAVDLAVLSEPREAASLGFRDHTSLYNQDPALALPYTALSDLAPVEDDQAVRNDITVVRTGGSSSRQALDVGPLSTAAPPAGVGTYDEQVELNVEFDTDLDDQASYRLRIGTADEIRYPSVNLSLLSPVFRASAALTAAALDLDQGDLITVTGPPGWLPPEDIRQLAQGFTETITETRYDIEVNCTPASVWDVGVYNESGNTASRYSSNGTELAEALDTTETGVDVTTPDGPVWTTDAAEYPLDLMVGGERMTATACSGAGPGQTFVVTRSTNSVVKSHAIGTPVELFKPAHYSL